MQWWVEITVTKNCLWCALTGNKLQWCRCMNWSLCVHVLGLCKRHWVFGCVWHWVAQQNHVGNSPWDGTVDLGILQCLNITWISCIYKCYSWQMLLQWLNFTANDKAGTHLVCSGHFTLSQESFYHTRFTTEQDPLGTRSYCCQESSRLLKW